MELPEENKVLIIRTKENVDFFGVKKGIEYFRINPIYGKSCKCTVGHVLILIDSDNIKSWKYPDNQKQMNDIYEEFL